MAPRNVSTFDEHLPYPASSFKHEFWTLSQDKFTDQTFQSLWSPELQDYTWVPLNAGEG